MAMERKRQNAKYATRIVSGIKKECPLCRYLYVERQMYMLPHHGLHCVNSLTNHIVVESCEHFAEKTMVIEFLK